MDGFASRLRKSRERAGLSLAALANLVEVNTSTVHRWESAKTEPNTRQVLALAQVLRVRFEWLVSGAGNMGIRLPRRRARNVVHS